MGTQKGKPALPPVIAGPSTRSSTTAHTPKKMKKRKEHQRNILPALEVTGLPDSKKRKLQTSSTPKPAKKQTTKSYVPGKCQVCKRIWESKDDAAFRKAVGKRKSTWIGCDDKSCKYWAHALCAGLLLIPKKKVEDHNFLCPLHSD